MSHDGIIDLRSGTVTWPTPEMRRAVAEADAGDDGYGEDPTVRPPSAVLLDSCQAIATAP